MSWRLVQGIPWPTPIESLDLAPVTPAIKAVTSPATRMGKAEENEMKRFLLNVQNA